MRTHDLQLPVPEPFYKTYIDTLGDVELMDTMRGQLKNFPKFMDSIPENKMNYAYAEGKWTIAEVLVHIIDTERIFQYRALRFCRGDTTPLPGFDQEIYIAGIHIAGWTREGITEEYKIVRQSTLALFANLDRAHLERSGMASNLEWSVAALGFAICGHQKHHRNIIRERYL